LVASLAALVAAVGTLGLAVAAATPAAADNWAPVSPGDFPDPDILHVPATDSSPAVYYSFATQNFASASQTINIQELTSSDGVNWTHSSVTDALPALGAWARPGDTWAPSVAFNPSDDQYYMYYTATESTGPGDQCIGVATSSTPQGPYSSQSTPVVCQDGSTAATIDDGNYGGSIDPDVFTDPQTNQPYLIWKNDGNHESPPLTTSIWSVPLASNFLPESGSVTTLLPGAQFPWQSGIVEGPQMYYQPGKGTNGAGGAYYLFYSGGDEGASSYAIGWAICSGPMGPCTDQSSNGPLLGSAPGMSGPGGPDVYALPGGQTVLAFAAWQGATIGYLSCGIRPMYLASLSFSGVGGSPSLSAYDQNVSPASSPSCPPPPPPGYWQVGSDGGIFTFGSAQFYGSTGSMKLNKPVVGMAATSDGKGYWLVASDGGIFAYGDAQFYGSTGSMVLNKPIIGMVPTLDGGGYWLVASDGGVFAFGDAKFYGSTGGNPPPSPITSVAPGFLDGGYWMADANGQVFNFGDAPGEGYPSSAPDGYTISGIAPTHDDYGYWLSSWNGNVAHFGDAPNLGSMYGTNLAAPIVGITATRDGGGFWLQGSDGGIFTFGDAPFLGSMGGQHLNAPMVGITSI
jgi:Glycosyl hydrolases family 43